MLFQATLSMMSALPWMPQLSLSKLPIVSHIMKPPFSHHTLRTSVNVNHGLILPGSSILNR
jgi:hypothetical protein